MPRLNHENLGKVQKTAYLTATIASTDSENDTACFEESGKCPAGTDIPIFYHCQYEEGEEPAQRDNGALEGASGAFAEDDEVVVQCEVVDSTTYKPLYIIGFVDKPKQCCFPDPYTEEDFTWVEKKSVGGDGRLEYITSASGALDYSAVFDKPSGAPYPDIFRGGNGVWYRIWDLDLTSCKYLVFNLTAVNIIDDPIGWSGGSGGHVAVIFTLSGEVMVSIEEGAVPGLYYKENRYPGRKIKAVTISGGYYRECYDISTIHNEVHMTFEYIKMSNEIPAGGIEVFTRIPV